MSNHDVAQRACKKQAGFTLIELLIVIAIIAILAAIAIPMFLKYKQGAYLDSVRSDVKNTVTAWESYAATNGSYPAYISQYLGPGPGSISCTTGGNGTCTFNTATTQTSSADIAVSAGNFIEVVASPEGCTNGYMVEGYSKNISSGPGSKDTPVSYDSCTGQYSGF